MEIKSIYDFMAYTNDKEQKYEVVNTMNTSKLKLGDIISYIGCYSYAGDIDKIEILNHSTTENHILDYSALNTRIIKNKGTK
jgi:hypothetical protein